MVGYQQWQWILVEGGPHAVAVVVALGIELRDVSRETFNRELVSIGNLADGFEHYTLVGRHGEREFDILEVVVSTLQILEHPVEERVVGFGIGGGITRKRYREDALARNPHLYVALKIRGFTRVDAGDLAHSGSTPVAVFNIRAARGASLMYKSVLRCTIMNASEGVAPAVESILAAARERDGGETRLSVSARSLPEALDAAERDGRVPVIGEVKPTSPTTDGRRTENPTTLAESMVESGAAAISVLTEPDHFGGSPDALRRVRETVSVPVLRKDFILREEQLDVVEADAVLLIARFVENLSELVSAARERGFQPLVEVHSRNELDRALAAGADIIGVNNRDLARLEVDHSTFENVATEVPDDVTLIAESGISSQEDAARMRRAGADGLLIGSAIMDGDVEANTWRLTTEVET